jgi:hypothetical protein
MVRLYPSCLLDGSYMRQDMLTFRKHLGLFPVFGWDPAAHLLCCVVFLFVLCQFLSDAKIFDIIYQLSPLLECEPVTLLFYGRQTVGSHSDIYMSI